MPELLDFPDCYTAIDPGSVRALDVDDAGRPGAIEVRGFTRGCPTVIFEIEGLSGVAPITVQGSQPAGRQTQWVPFTVTFDLDHQHEVCGQEITVVARCQDNPECEQSLTITLECEGCPSVENLSAAALGCDQLNTRFRLRATVSGFRPPGTRVFWHFGDGPTSRSEDIELQGTIADEVVEAEHAYAPPGPYQASLEFATRPGCAGGQVIVPADQFLDCVADTPDCPTVTVSASPTAGNICDVRDRRDMTLTVTTTVLPTPKLAFWDFGDENFSAPFNLLLNQPQSVRHAYDVPGTYQATLTITDCPPRSLTVDVTAPCPPPSVPPVPDCPVVQFSATAEEGCSEPGRRRVTLHIVVQSAPTPKAAQLDFGDGSAVVDGFIVVGQSFDIDHFYTVGSTYTTRLTIEGCGEEEVTVDVTAPCPDDGPPPLPQCPEGETFDPVRGMCVPNWVPLACPILFWIAMGLLALAAALAVIWGCLVPASIPTLTASVVVFVFALIFLAIWLWLCARFFCIVVNTVRRVLALLSMLSVVAAAIVAALGQGPCGLGLLLSFGYFGVFYIIVTEVSTWIGCLEEQNG